MDKVHFVQCKQQETCRNKGQHESCVALPVICWGSVGRSVRNSQEAEDELWVRLGDRALAMNKTELWCLKTNSRIAYASMGVWITPSLWLSKYEWVQGRLWTKQCSVYGINADSTQALHLTSTFSDLETLLQIQSVYAKEPISSNTYKHNTNMDRTLSQLVSTVNVSGETIHE